MHHKAFRRVKSAHHEGLLAVRGEYGVSNYFYCYFVKFPVKWILGKTDAIFDLRALASFSGLLSELKGPESTRNQSYI